MALLLSLSLFPQQRKQKRADTLFNKFSFVKAAKLYRELVQDNYNRNYATRKLADSYALLRDPRNASRYYKSAVKQKDVPVEYYYKYAQSLRGMKKYDESQIWLQRYKDSGGVVDTDDFSKDLNFITSVFGAKQQYFLDRVRFNSKYSDFGAFEHDGLVYFASSRDEGVAIKRLYGWDEQPFLDIYVTKAGSKRNVDHTAKLKGDINSIYHDGPVTITKDGKTMYFSRNNFKDDIELKDKNGLTNMKIYRATKVDSLWTNVEDLSINSDDYSTQHAALNVDETKLYFTSDRPGTHGGSDIWTADIAPDGSLGNIQNLGDVVNTEKAEGFPFINNEGVLFFSSDGHTGLGLLDIYAAIKGEDEESIVDVINLGVPVNSNKDDFAFSMNQNGITGYFASNRQGGRGSDDIYAFHREPALHVEGVVTDAINTFPIVGAKITLFDENDNQIAFMETDDNGYFQINIDRNQDYKIVANQDKYIEDYREFTSKDLQTELTSIGANLLLNPVQDVVKLAEIDLNTIYFNFDSHIIRADAEAQLNKIVSLMQNDYPEMVIRIESHTDSRGTLSYNDKLSIDRANSTYEYLISKGIDPSRITEHQGFGERKLTNGCQDGQKCEEKQHQLNRRTQFIVVKME
ncbi:OmpA family protein [Algibacter amylolyticus]|uniref:OmpA family protein n=1 Tax=Algibacter amylolyticus TaxID=1608400 RepID=A0A5M7AYP7_9FLAO|nr:OmpA family protein [Algibacter amylolyticus]KAA5821127.1 OmpA family protein [Algibacter amylolyticus]MBB5269772.1 outer membrane protein OmpA-like peptidoglycan-associated protein [Algibacter amylolyticus]TSJ72073.1 OmpA family protein [Algibacter amylolyticus]